MATNFPGSVDDAATVGDNTHPSADEALSSTTGGPAHHALHQNVGLAINAIEDKVGTGSSTPAANTVLTGTGSGTSAWATVSTAMIGDDQVTAAKIHDDAVTKVVVEDTTDATCFPALFESATGSLEPHTDAGLTYNASNGTLTATAFEGPLTGNVTGNASGSSGSCTGNAATATALATARAINGVDFDGTAAITVTAAAGTLTGTTLKSTVTASSLESVGTLSSLTVGGVLDANGVVKIIDGSAGTPALTFDSDENTGIYSSGADTIAFSTGGSLTASVSGNLNVHGTDASLTAADPIEGTGDDAEWALSFTTYYLRRNSSLASSKENISDDLGTHLTADMVDSVVPKMWNRKAHPGYPEIGPLADDMDAISPFLVNRGTDAEGDPVLTGINKTAYLSLLVLAVKDLRTQVADLTTRLEALEG